MIDWTYEDEIYELSLAHPPLNEIGMEVLGGLERFLDQVDASARALIIHSKLEGGFCAGADLKELHASIKGRDPGDYREELSRFLDRIHSVMDRLDALPMTTIGALHGVCFGGGFELALTCDVLVAERSTRFCFPELRLGIIPGFGGIPRLRREVPAGVVRDLILTGRSINASRAHALGLVSQLVGKGHALEVSREVARQVRRFDPVVSRRAKAFLKSIPREALAAEKALFLELFQDRRVEQALGRFVDSGDVMPYLPEEVSGGG